MRRRPASGTLRREALAQIEKLCAADQAAADIEGFTEWLTNEACHLEELTEKVHHIADAATEACIIVRHLNGEQWFEVGGTACHARDDLYCVHFCLIRWDVRHAYGIHLLNASIY